MFIIEEKKQMVKDVQEDGMGEIAYWGMNGAGEGDGIQETGGTSKESRLRLVETEVGTARAARIQSLLT